MCINADFCQPVLTVLHNLHAGTKSNVSKEFIQKYQCGYDRKKKIGKVCCPLDNTSPEISSLQELVTKSPQVTTEDSNRTSEIFSKSKCGRISVNRDRIVGGAKAELG